MALEQWKLQQNLPDNHMDAPPFSGYVQAKALASGVAELVTVPSGATHVVMRGTADFAALAGGAWSDSSTAGVWASYWLTARTSSFHSVGFRAASYL